MRKVGIVATCVIVGMLLTGAAWGTGYHEVYDGTTGSWVKIGGPLEDGHHAEMFSASPELGNQYQFRSDGRATVGSTTQYGPLATDPLIKTIENKVQYYPWLKVSLNETVLTWDIFKPGKYMSKGPIVSLQANCPVMVFVGSFNTANGKRIAWWVDNDPVLQIPHVKNHTTELIEFVDYGGSHGDLTNKIEDKPRVHSLLKSTYDTGTGEWTDGEGFGGTDPDVIKMAWWGYMANDVASISEYLISAGELAMVPTPNHADWYTPAELEAPGAVEFIPDCVDLHNTVYLVSFEEREVEDCVSEGFYYEKFTLFFAPADP